MEDIAIKIITRKNKDNGSLMFGLLINGEVFLLEELHKKEIPENIGYILVALENMFRKFNTIYEPKITVKIP